ncbi:uncharacterized protein LOC117579196 isoform X2 [Drosophila guanche]|uniref:uncharacterized protein LOC117579196 isoform X2 n=1 Tax=Drosophila guanche TaxID=7266 RepID=UPI00147173C7|nr:uncharacterized protein LOC117579196 isoform X2 [Drosophila guanche]
METTSFVDLNDDCIAGILKRLPARDHMHFGQVCSRFRNVQNDYAAGLYKRLELTDSDQELRLLRKAGEHVRILFLSLEEEPTPRGVLPKTLGALANLERITLKCEIGPSCCDINCIIKCIEKLHKIESVGLIRGDKTLSSVDKYADSVDLHSSFVVDVEENGLQEDTFRIGVLPFGNGSIEKALADMVPHLTHVREVDLTLDRPAREYLPITQIPELHTLSLFWNHVPMGPLLPLLSALAAAHSGNLINLVLGVRHLEPDEVKEIARIHSLQDLQLYFAKPSYIYHLTELRNLVRLRFNEQFEQGTLSSPVLAVIQACPNLTYLHLENVMSNDFIYKTFAVLQQTRDLRDPKTLFLAVPQEQVRGTLQDPNIERYIHLFGY